MCTCDDFSRAEFYDVTYPKARKPHRCVECRVHIAPGTRYSRHTQKWEGEVSSTTFCVDCDAWSKALLAAQHEACGCAGWLYGEMWSTIGEFTDEHLGYDHETGEPRQTEKQYREELEARRSRTVVMDTTRPSV